MKREVEGATARERRTIVNAAGGPARACCASACTTSSVLMSADLLRRGAERLDVAAGVQRERAGGCHTRAATRLNVTKSYTSVEGPTAGSRRPCLLSSSHLAKRRKLSHPYFKSDYHYCCCCGGGGSGGGFITSTTSLRPKLFLQILLVIALYFCYLCGSPNAPPRAAGSALRCGAANCWRESFG